ncbi:hypothetical protein RUND412_005502, partial [Rhizina undulata]
MNTGALPRATPSRKKDLIAMVVMAMLGFARSERANRLQTTLGFFSYAYKCPKRIIAVLHRLGPTCSYETIIEALKTSVKGNKASLQERCAGEPFIISYDNLDVHASINDQRLHTKDTLHHNTISGVVFLRQQDGKSSSISPHQNWIPMNHLQEFSANDIFKPLVRIMAEYWPSACQNIFCKTGEKF